MWYVCVCVCVCMGMWCVGYDETVSNSLHVSYVYMYVSINVNAYVCLCSVWTACVEARGQLLVLFPRHYLNLVFVRQWPGAQHRG